MLSKNDSNLKQVQLVSIEDLVPEDHILRKIDNAVDFSFIYELVEDKYCLDNGRPSVDPVTLIKIPIIQYLFGIRSMRQTIREIEVNIAYKWFLGLDFYDKVPHFSTFGKNYKRRFEGSTLFEDIFKNILKQCMKHNLVDTKTIFVDATHIKAHANNKKYETIEVLKDDPKEYTNKLKEEIRSDREKHFKKELKEMKKRGKSKKKKISTSDKDSGWFHKGEHKSVFAYSAQVGCDKNGWILGYSIHPGNKHDSVTFKDIYEKLSVFTPTYMVMDAGYKTPWIAKKLLDDGITPIMPYKRPMTKKGYFKKYEYVYDEYYDEYICPANELLKYRTTNREGYKLYHSDGSKCEKCKYLKQCTGSKDYKKIVSRHIWQEYLDKVEDIRHSIGMKEIYQKRKETIERVFGVAKEHHHMRYTNMVGKEAMEMKLSLTFACINMKKLAKMLWKMKGNGVKNGSLLANFMKFLEKLHKKKPIATFE